jgi:hypothetical protein
MFATPTSIAMNRLLVLGLLCCVSAPASAQDVFVAPTYNSVFASSEQGFGTEEAHQLFVTNKSTVPIIVFGVSLSSCDNVKQSCEARRTKINIPAGQRRNVGKVQAKDTEKGFEYRWSFSFSADSSDAKVLAALRAHGAKLGGEAPVDSVQPIAAPSPERQDVIVQAAQTTPPAERIAYRSPGLDARLREMDEERQRTPVRVRFKVGYGSIIGSTMMPNTPVQPTGACVDPAREAAYARDTKIAKTPWRPAVVPRGMAGPSLAGMRRAMENPSDTTAATGDLLVRFVADTSGTIIPESVSVLESRDGELSVRACTSVMGTHVTPARNKEGRAIQSWVQMPLTVSRY